jgi:hypothetical protein
MYILLYKRIYNSFLELYLNLLLKLLNWYRGFAYIVLFQHPFSADLVSYHKGWFWYRLRVVAASEPLKAA